VRVCLDALGPAIDAWRQIMTFAALASIILGAVAAYGQTNLKRLLAYSSINNVGFALVGLVAGGAAGASAVLFYMAVYIVMTLGTFLCVLRLRGEDGEPLEAIDSLSGLSQSRPGLAAAIAIFMFSLAGIPPLLGFWPKLVVFQAALAQELYLLAIVGFLGSVVGAFYYIKIVKVMYFDAPGRPLVRTGISRFEGALIFLAAALVSPLGYFLIGSLTTMTDNAAGSLF
jgi:NADH-quinone oxidoreductase subunit N